MVEDAVEHDADTVLMKCAAHLRKIFIGSESRIDPGVIAGVVSVRVGFEDRGKIDRADPQLFKVRDPVLHLPDPVLGDPVILKGSPAKAQRINLIEYAFICPHKLYLSLRCFLIHRIIISFSQTIRNVKRKTGPSGFHKIFDRLRTGSLLQKFLQVGSDDPFQ